MTSDIYDTMSIELSLKYANEYRDRPKNFITCFLKYPSIRTACELIVTVYKKTGAFAECQESGKDFTEYANTKDLSERWRVVLAEVLLIIYSLLQE